MVCFELIVKIPQRVREVNRRAVGSRIKHLCKHYNASYAEIKTETNWSGDVETFYKIRICDEDTVALLRDFPQPFNVATIHILRSGELLYKFRRHIEPARIPILTEVYWMAKSSEKWDLA